MLKLLRDSCCPVCFLAKWFSSWIGHDGRSKASILQPVERGDSPLQPNMPRHISRRNPSGRVAPDEAPQGMIDYKLARHG